MKYSILVPVYNVEKYLHQCLDSLVSQTFRDFEVILADDGSTDSSGRICDEYAQLYPELFRVFHKKNEGLLLTRRFSLKQAKGEYILFVDSDDYVVPELLETVDKAFGQYACDMVLYTFYRFADGDTQFTVPQIPCEDGTIFEGEGKKELYRMFALKHTFSNMWIKAVKRSAVDIDADYKPWNVSRGEDIIQSFALLDGAERIAFIDKPLYYYRKNEGAVTSRVRPVDYKNYLTWTDRTFLYLEHWGLNPEAEKQFAARQMSHFYVYLRDISRKADREKNFGILKETVQNLGTDIRFQRVLDVFNAKDSPPRLRLRLRILSEFMKRRYWMAICRMIQLSNLLGGK